MIASVLTLDRHAVQSLRIKDPYSIHKLIYSLFPGNQREFLYYDEGGNYLRRSVLIVSHQQPLIPEAGDIQSKKIPDDYLSYESYAFQVQLNPVIRKHGHKKLIPVTGRNELTAWFLRKQQSWGFQADPERLEVSDVGVQEIVKKDQVIIQNMATFRGILRVTHTEAFKTSFCNGIGRSKAYGFGLLQIKPLAINTQ